MRALKLQLNKVVWSASVRGGGLEFSTHRTLAVSKPFKKLVFFPVGTICVMELMLSTEFTLMESYLIKRTVEQRQMCADVKCCHRSGDPVWVKCLGTVVLNKCLETQYYIAVH